MRPFRGRPRVFRGADNIIEAREKYHDKKCAKCVFMPRFFACQAWLFSCLRANFKTRPGSQLDRLFSRLNRPARPGFLCSRVFRGPVRASRESSSPLGTVVVHYLSRFSVCVLRLPRLPAWQEMPGRKCRAENAWQEMPGRKCLAENAWQEMPGRKCLAGNAWQKMPGRKCLAENAGQKMPGRKCRAENAGQKMPGRKCRAENAGQDAGSPGV